LQGHVECRRKEGASAVTLKEEVATVRACWNRAGRGGFITGGFPDKGLRFPKEGEKEPFRTFTTALPRTTGPSRRLAGRRRGRRGAPGHGPAV
jgi:hypothetical protein